MSDESPVAEKATKPAKQAKPKGTPIGRLTLAQVDTALADCDKTIKIHTETVKSKLTGGGAIPTDAMRELSRANAQKSRLTHRRISLLLDAGDAAAVELIDKLLKLKPAKVATA